ncbi:hypothetical protein BDV96DRAFT_494582 [Lophiotrema nucula]|uniref:rRNA-processing protein EFG1 n=1 Tax=Lophiotrema nucula TaxID=690887 RepID=A0A6A5Z7W2_9PLEO|nr:hypothetical protein BDV96DRAFT_494582 [Lophiotrema nucula]
MSHKRKASELAGGDDNSQRFAKKNRPAFNKHGPQSKSKGPKRFQPADEEPKTKSTNSLKSRIRDLRRLLEHVDNEPKHKMPANVRIERERELEACEHELAEKTAVTREAEQRKKLISKYHQVRFFDRQKATRILKKLKKELSTTSDASRKKILQRRIHNAEVDINYAIYYPLMKPYSSLYPKAKREESKSEEVQGEEASNLKNMGQDTGPKGDQAMWRTVEQAMKEGTLDALRNSNPSRAERGRQDDDDRLAQKKTRKDKKKPPIGVMQKMSKETKAAAAQEEDDESDGGFFE